MEPYWSYEDIGAFFFVLVVVATLVRLGIRTHLLRPSDLVAPSLPLQTSIIIFLGIALYAVLKWRHQKPVIAPLGWVAPFGIEDNHGVCVYARDMQLNSIPGCQVLIGVRDPCNSRAFLASGSLCAQPSRPERFACVLNGLG
jgi:hypothetical protein